MAQVSGPSLAVGIGIESAAAPGTPVAASFYPMVRDFSLQAVSEKTFLNAARGNRNASVGKRVKRRYGQGSLEVVPNVKAAPYLFGMALGTVNSVVASGETIVYEHTITPTNNQATMKTATIIKEIGGEVTERYAGCVVNTLNLEVSDDFASLTTEILSRFPDTTTLTESYTEETEFVYSDYTAKFGTSLSNAAGNSATPLSSFSLNINNNVLLDTAFRSGSNQPVAGGFYAGRLEVSGSYSLPLDGTTDLNNYKNNVDRALIVSFQGAAIGVAETEEIQIRLGQLVLDGPPVEFNLDGIFMIRQNFTALRDVTDGDISVVVTNGVAGTAYTVA
jgi:hypothetical protein